MVPRHKRHHMHNQSIDLWNTQILIRTLVFHNEKSLLMLKAVNSTRHWKQHRAQLGMYKHSRFFHLQRCLYCDKVIMRPENHMMILRACKVGLTEAVSGQLVASHWIAARSSHIRLRGAHIWRHHFTTPCWHLLPAQHKTFFPLFHIIENTKARMRIATAWRWRALVHMVDWRML